MNKNSYQRALPGMVTIGYYGKRTRRICVATLPTKYMLPKVCRRDTMLLGYFLVNTHQPRF